MGTAGIFLLLEHTLINLLFDRKLWHAGWMLTRNLAIARTMEPPSAFFQIVQTLAPASLASLDLATSWTATFACA